MHVNDFIIHTVCTLSYHEYLTVTKSEYAEKYSITWFPLQYAAVSDSNYWYQLNSL